MQRQTCYFSGHVQGVGFRYTAHNLAPLHRLHYTWTGWLTAGVRFPLLPPPAGSGPRGSTSAAGANSIGSVTLVGGTVTVSTTAVTTNSLIQIWRQSVGATGAAALGNLSVGTIVNGTSFVINAWQAADATALQASDVSVIGWEIIN